VALKVSGKIVENLAVGTALGFLTLIVAALSLVADARSIASERDALSLAPLSATIAVRVDDPSFDRIYEMHDASGLSYGAVLALRSPDDSALVQAKFSPSGELRDLRYLGACSSRLPSDVHEAVSGFTGADEALNRAADAVRAIVRGANGEAGS
jgi:hypothetical protein